MMPTEIRVLEFYSGIGGLRLALQRSSVPGSVQRAYDWDQASGQVYEANFGLRSVHKVDIGSLTALDLPASDLWLLSPSCQPYTVLNPAHKGDADPRAKSFLHLIDDVLPDLVQSKRHPSHLLVENVAGFETSTTRQRLLATLKALSYATTELLLTPLQFGIPNSRLRYYCLAKTLPLKFAFVDTADDNLIWRHIPGRGSAWEDPRFNLVESVEVNEVRTYLDEAETAWETSPCRVPDKVLVRWGRLFDIVKPSSRRTCCFTRGYTQMVERSGSILQMNETLDTTSTFDKFLEAQAGGQDAVHVLHPLQLRYFSPTELLRLFCFLQPIERVSPTTFQWPRDMSTKTKYRLIGNSVNVKVVTELIHYLFEGDSEGEDRRLVYQ